MDIFTEVQRVLGLKTKKDKWVEEAAPVLIDVNRQIKEIEGDMEIEMARIKPELKSIQDRFQVALKPLNEMDTRLRERVLKEHPSTDVVVNPQGVGKLVFPETWGYEVEDIKKVDKEYRIEVVDAKKVKDAIKKGVRSIKGLTIKQTVGLRVYTKEETSKWE